jgi:hypothetical protein
LAHILDQHAMLDGGDPVPPELGPPRAVVVFQNSVQTRDHVVAPEFD